MDKDLQSFLQSQFIEAKSSVQNEEELPQLINNNSERYLNKEFLAEGGQKKIFRCQDTMTGRVVAYANLKDDTDQEKTAKFIREARLTAHLEHPHIIPVYDSGVDKEGQLYFTMKLISGKTFEEYLNEEHSLQSCIDILLKVCEAAHFAHDKGINHFDIKPDNIQVSDYGEVLLSDWGLAGISYESCSEEVLDDEILKKVDLSQSLDLHFKGTVGYAAPEMWEKEGQRNKLCDLYSLGAILYKILCKKTAEMKVDWNSLQGPEALQAVCRKAMQAKDERYQSATEFIKELKAWRNGFATKAENASFLTTVKLLILRHRNVSVAIISALLLIFFLSLVFIGFLKNKELAASKLAQKLQVNEVERRQLERELSPQYLTKAYEAFTRTENDAALALCDHILRTNPQSKKARRLKGLILFTEQKFKASLLYLKGIIKDIAIEYQDKPPPSLPTNSLML